MNNGILDGLANDRPFTVEGFRSLSSVINEPVAAVGSKLGATQSWPGTANTLTGWVEITASSPYDVCALDVIIFGAHTNSVDSCALIDIGIGSPGAETVLIDGIPIYGKGGFCYNIRFPIRVPGSTRFSWRMQAASTSASISATPGVALGFIKDIPEFPAGSSVTAVGTIARASSTYTNISVAAVGLNRRTIWATIGDLPAGKVIYLIPFAMASTASIGDSHTILDWGWSDQSGIAVNTQVADPREVWAAQVMGFSSSAETMESNIPTVWIPDGYYGGSIVATADLTSSLHNKWMCFAVVQ